MLRLISSFLVLLLGTAGSPARGAHRRASLRHRWRQRPDDDGALARALEASERPRARARQLRWSWAGSLELVQQHHTVEVPGTWTLTNTPFHRSISHAEQHVAAPIPDPSQDPSAWASRMRSVLSMQEPGTQLRVGNGDGNGWKTLEVAIPTQPPTIVQVDRNAVAQLLHAPVVIRLRINA